MSWLPNIVNSNYPLRSLETILRTVLMVGLTVGLYSALTLNRRLIIVVLQSMLFMGSISVCFALLSIAYPAIFWMFRLELFPIHYAVNPHVDIFSFGWPTSYQVEWKVPVWRKLKGFSALSPIIIPVILCGWKYFSRGYRSLSLCALAGYLFLIWETYNRAAIAGILGIFISLILVLILVRVERKKVLLALGVFALVFTSILFWLKTTRGFLEGVIKEMIADGVIVSAHEEFKSLAFDYWPIPLWLIDFQRQLMWFRSIELGLDKPWFGIGANTINLLPGASALIQTDNNLRLVPSHPHNWAIETFAETGTLGFLLLSTTIVCVGICILKKLQVAPNKLAMSCAMSVFVGYWVSGLFNFSFWAVWWQLSFLITFCVCLSAANFDENASTSTQ